jgi:DNA-binding HxlR family transcriptional regulator/CheY-like chemotaxis protein
MRIINEQYGCPVEVALDMIGGKWKCVILWWLRRGSKRFGELMKLMPRITQKVLTSQLRELEADKLIAREVFQESPPRVEYSLTPFGDTLRPITELMCDWGKKYSPEFQFGIMCLRGLKILVIADELVNQRLQAELGELRGAVVIVLSLEIALQDFEKICPDVVIIDFGVKDDFGNLHNLINLISKLDQPVPSIILAKNEQVRDRAFSQGFSTHLIEPIEISELVGAIANLTG